MLDSKVPCQPGLFCRVLAASQSKTATKLRFRQHKLVADKNRYFMWLTHTHRKVGPRLCWVMEQTYRASEYLGLVNSAAVIPAGLGRRIEN